MQNLYNRWKNIINKFKKLITIDTLLIFKWSYFNKKTTRPNTYCMMLSPTGCGWLCMGRIKCMHSFDLFARYHSAHTDVSYWGEGLWRILGSSSGGLLSPWGRFFSSDLGGAAAGGDAASQLPLLKPPLTTGHDGSWVDLHHSRSVAHSREAAIKKK